MTKARGEAPKPSIEPLTVPVVQAAVEPTMVPARALLASNPTAIQAEIIATFGSSAKTALCIANAESGFQPGAKHYNANMTWDLGIFQINDVHGLSWTTRLDPFQNIQEAYRIYRSWGNWSAWATHKNCGV